MLTFQGRSKYTFFVAGFGTVLRVSEPYNIEVKATVSSGGKIVKVISHTNQIDVNYEQENSVAKVRTGHW